MPDRQGMRQAGQRTQCPSRTRQTRRHVGDLTQFGPVGAVAAAVKAHFPGNFQGGSWSGFETDFWVVFWGICGTPF